MPLKEYNEVIELLKAFPKAEVAFDNRLLVKKSPHNIVISCYGVRYHNDVLWLMDFEGNQILFYDNRKDADLICASLLHRLKLLKHEAAK